MKPVRVVITGAAGAIGGAVATSLRTHDPDVALVLVDRDEAGLERVAAALPGSGAVVSVVADLSNPSGVDLAVAALDGADGLVNAAGIMSVRLLQALPWDQGSDILAVDFLAPMRLMHAHVAALRANDAQGFVVNVTSMAGRVPLKGCAFYGAAKAGLSMASEIARAELAPHGVRVVTVYPGPVRSQLEAGARSEYQSSAAANAIPVGDPAVLGHLIVQAVQRDRGRVVYPAVYRLGVAAPALAERIALGFGPSPIA